MIRLIQRSLFLFIWACTFSKTTTMMFIVTEKENGNIRNKGKRTKGINKISVLFCQISITCVVKCVRLKCFWHEKIYVLLSIYSDKFEKRVSFLDWTMQLSICTVLPTYFGILISKFRIDKQTKDSFFCYCNLRKNIYMIYNENSGAHILYI